MNFFIEMKSNLLVSMLIKNTFCKCTHACRELVKNNVLNIFQITYNVHLLVYIKNYNYSCTLSARLSNVWITGGLLSHLTDTLLYLGYNMENRIYTSLYHPYVPTCTYYKRHN